MEVLYGSLALLLTLIGGVWTLLESLKKYQQEQLRQLREFLEARFGAMLALIEQRFAASEAARQQATQHWEQLFADMRQRIGEADLRQAALHEQIDGLRLKVADLDNAVRRLQEWLKLDGPSLHQ